MCSEYGFYVIGEADMESHGMAMRYGNHSNENYADAADDPQFGRPFWTGCSAASSGTRTTPRW